MHIQEHIGLKYYTSLHAGGKADKLVKVDTGDSFPDVLAAEKDGPLWVLGYGTNCLVSDRGLPGTVILNQGGQIQRLEGSKVRVDSGVKWDDFIQYLISNDLWGLEFTSGIPGGSGAAVTGNIAAYGHKVADSFLEANILDRSDGSHEVWTKEQLGFNYRSSKLQDPVNSNKIIIDATFGLNPIPSGELEYESALKIGRELGAHTDTLPGRRQIIMETRKRASSLLTDVAAGPFTAGSFFKNPLVDEAQVQNIVSHEEKGVSREQLLRQNQIHGLDKARVSAAHVLLAAGFSRGQTWGNVRLNPDHILKIENTGEATASEIYAVVQDIIGTVKQRLGIELEPEVRFLGEF